MTLWLELLGATLLLLGGGVVIGAVWTADAPEWRPRATPARPGPAASDAYLDRAA